MPVLNGQGQLRGALTISGLRARFDEAARAEALALLRQSAERLSASLPGD